MPKSVHQFDFSGLTSPLTPELAGHLATLKSAHHQQRRHGMAGAYQPARADSATLNTGAKIPLLGLGTWKSKAGEVEAAVEAAIKAGYRHIDCAAIYGNEQEVGRALKRVLDEGVVQRSELFVTSKLWNTEHAAERVEAACRKTLRDLQLDYLDLYLVHWPVTGSAGATVQPPLLETWRGMEGVARAGLARAVGVSNWSIVKLRQLLGDAAIPPAVNQVEVHPYWRNDELLAFCRDQGIHVSAYSPLGSPDSAAMFKRRAPVLMEEPILKSVADRVGRNIGQVLIRWGLQHGTSVLAKSTNPQRIQSNLEAFDFELSPEEYERLSSLDTQCRMVPGADFLKPEGPYRTLAELWDEPDADVRQRAALAGGYRLHIPCPVAQLNTGAAIPLVGLGTWKSEPGEVHSAVATALRLGYRHLDCASVYKNESEVGEALAQVLREGVIARGDLFVTSKLWNADHAPGKVEQALRASLAALKLDHLDLYLMHMPVTGNVGPTVEPPLEVTWAAMEACVDKGLTKAIGVSNFSVRKLQQLLSGCRIKPAVNQVEVHPYWRNDELLAFCRDQGIHVSAYSPLGSGDSSQSMKRQGRKLLEDPLLEEVAKELGKSPAQVLLRWGLQHGTSVLPKSTNPQRLKENLDCLDWDLPSDGYKALSGLDYQQRMLTASWVLDPRGPYRTLQELWDDGSGGDAAPGGAQTTNDDVGA